MSMSTCKYWTQDSISLYTSRHSPGPHALANVYAPAVELAENIMQGSGDHGLMTCETNLPSYGFLSEWLVPAPLLWLHHAHDCK